MAYAPRPLIFLHIPKAAGSTLQELIVRQYAGGRSFTFTGDQGRYSEFAGMSAAERGSFDVLLGHVQFGVHEHLPDPATYITMLREPVDRVVSHFHFILQRKEHYLHESLRRRGYSLREWLLEARPLVVDNYQLRWLISRPMGEVAPGEVTRSMLDEAKWNLENAFSVVGLTERFEESLSCMARAFGWSDLEGQENRNTNPIRPALDEVDPSTLAAIHETNRLDVELHEFACALFEQQCAQLRVPSRPDRSSAVMAAREALAVWGDAP